MKKGVLWNSFIGLVAFFAISNGDVFAQTKIKGEQFEEIASYWHKSMLDLQKKLGISNNDFKIFAKFYEHRIDSEKAVFNRKVWNGKITDANVKEAMAVKESQYIFLYKQFMEVKKEYPSSVYEYSSDNFHRALGTCNPGCTNIDFENGTLSGWNGFYAQNNSNSGYNITGVTGGALGAVTKAAFDPSTSSYQLSIMSGTAGDPLAPSVPVVSPFGGKYSVRVGDSTIPNQGVAILNQTFMVTAANANFTYEYAVFLENPNHTYYQQPFFNVALLDSKGDTIPHCGEYNVVSGSANAGFKGVYYAPEGDTVYYKNWTVVFASLKAYIGQCVTIQFEAVDCALGGHFGYAYVDASCSPLGLISSSPAFCGQKTISLTAPPGGTTYSWTGPTGGIVGQDTAQTITIDSAGNYQVIVTPVTGKFCADTISINIPKAPGPPPIPFFTADTVCQGTATQFTNASNPLTGAGVKFYWNFNGLGTYQDSTTNPSYTFSKAGTYPVKLYEVNNGCGTDTTINIKVDSNAVAAFIAANTCVGQTVNFTNNSTGAVSYSWSFGDGGNSTLVNPTHVYASGGTYTVTLVASSGGKCSDTVKQAISITPAPVVTVTGKDSICPGTFTTLTASGATTYTWTGPTGIIIGNPITVSPSSTATYTVSGSKGSCSGDTTFVVYVLTAPTPAIVTKPDTICVGSSSTLVASGGSTYTWSTGATTDSITVSPSLTTTYTLTAHNGICSANTTAEVVVIGSAPPSIHLSRDSICPNDTATLEAFGGTHYTWSTGATSSSIVVNPSITTPYYVVVRTKCYSDTLRLTLHIVPLPVVTISGNHSICAGTNTVLTSTGSGITSYKWSNGQTTASAVVNPAVNTTYSLTVSNGLCSVTDTFNVIVTPKPPVTITGPTLICPGDSITLTASSPVGVYSWSNGATGSSITVPVSKATTYDVVVTKGCSDTAYHTVAVYPVKGITACCTDTIKMGSSTTIVATGATGYVWSPVGSGIDCYTCPSTTVTPTVTTTYTVVGTDSNGCRSYATVIIYIECHDFDVPNVFTPTTKVSPPNNVFYIAGALGQPEYEIEIYDRWGVLIYKSSDPSQSWDGKTKGGAEAPDGVYYYIINASCDNNKYQKKGYVQIIR
jgi:gliding motility-associated-like protein